MFDRSFPHLFPRFHYTYSIHTQRRTFTCVTCQVERNESHFPFPFPFPSFLFLSSPSIFPSEPFAFPYNQHTSRTSPINSNLYLPTHPPTRIRAPTHLPHTIDYLLAALQLARVNLANLSRTISTKSSLELRFGLDFAFFGFFPFDEGSRRVRYKEERANMPLSAKQMEYLAIAVSS